MTTKQRDRDSDEKLAGEKVNACIIEELIRKLGRPTDLLAVHVRRLWGDHYRVNVLRGASIITSSIAHSYFVKANGDGAILTASPTIVKQYQE